MKKLYRVLDCSGEWEDYHEYCVCSTFDKAVAEKVKKYMEKEEEETIELAKRCEECIHGCGDKEQCDDYVKDEYGDCDNWFSHYNTSWFKIDTENVFDFFEEWLLTL